MTALLAVAVFGRASAAGDGISGANAADRAGMLVGTWKCVTIHDSSTTMTFTQAADGVLDMTNAFTQSDGGTGEFAEHYRFDTKAGRWSWTSSMPGPANSIERGTAAPWTGKTWIFDGAITSTTQPDADSIAGARTSSEPVRMIYTYYDDNAFHREFQFERNDQWLTRGASDCHRQR